MMAEATPELRAFNGAAIPDELKAQPRWAPWRAAFNAKRGKFDKIPHRADTPEYGLSTANPDRWFTFKAAVSAYEREAPSFAGVGYVMTRPHGIVGVDLDDCVHDGVVADWAREVIDALASYTEISPSGKGLRIFARGEVNDWTNHTVGVEVYGGAEPRFLTITGQHLPNTPTGLQEAPAAALEALRAQYGSDAERTDTPAVEMPELLDDLLTPDLANLNLPYAARDFLVEGDTRGDRSRELHAAAVSLYQCGLSDDEVLTLLATSPHAMEVALDHRRQDPDRALLYLWREHCLKAKAKGDLRRVATADDFEDVSAAAGSATVAQALKQATPAKGPRFQFHQAAEFSAGEPLGYWIKGLLPQAELAAIVGESGSGKTFFAVDVLMSIAQGTPWRERRVRQGTVAYVCAEGASGFRGRLQAYAEYHGVDLADVPLHILGDAPNMLERNDVKDLLAALRALPTMPAVICLDTWAQVTAGGDENSGQDMGRALAHCRALHKATGATILLIAHSGKDSDRGMRGWSGVKGAMDAEITVERSGQYRAATVTKLKDGMGEGDEYPFDLDVVTLGQDADGEDVTSCVLRARQAVPAAQRKAPPKGVWQQVVLRVATTLTDLADSVTPAELTEAVVSEMPTEEGKRDRRHFLAQRAQEQLIAGGHLSITNGCISLAQLAKPAVVPVVPAKAQIGTSGTTSAQVPLVPAERATNNE